MSASLPRVLRYGWSIDATAWVNFQRQVTPDTIDSWRGTPFTELGLSALPREPGVYMITARPAKAYPLLPASICNVLYVGQASNLRARVPDHLSKPSESMRRARGCFLHRLDCVFTTTREIDLLEALLISCFGPPINQKSGNMIRISFRNPVPA